MFSIFFTAIHPVWVRAIFKKRAKGRVMSLFQRIFRVDPWRQNARIAALADELAAACAADVRGSLSDRVFRMSPHESRGYVRARAMPAVVRVMDEAGRRHHVSPRWLPLLQAQVLDATTRMVHRQLAAMAPRLRLKRAA